MDALKEMRRRRGWSQKDLAEKSGVGQDTISGIESGRHEPRPSTLRKLAKALDVEVADFFLEPVLPKDEAPGEAGPKGATDRDLLEWALEQSATRLRDYAESEPRSDVDRLIRLMGKRVDNRAYNVGPSSEYEAGSDPWLRADEELVEALARYEVLRRAYERRFGRKAAYELENV